MLATKVQGKFYLKANKLRAATVLPPGLRRACGGLAADGQRCGPNTPGWAVPDRQVRYDGGGQICASLLGRAGLEFACVCKRENGLPSVCRLEEGGKGWGLCIGLLSLNLASRPSLVPRLSLSFFFSILNYFVCSGSLF